MNQADSHSSRCSKIQYGYKTKAVHTDFYNKSIRFPDFDLISQHQT